MTIFQTLLIASVLINILLAFLYALSFRKKPVERVLTVDATRLLGELSNGGAVIVTQVLDPNYIFNYSPKDI